MDIKCRKTSCVHNDRYNCMAKEVSITSQSSCATYERGRGQDDVSRDMFEAAPEYANAMHIRDKKLKCDCKSCLFNKDCKCDANGITIIDDHEKGACATFIYDE
ncbi:MAG: DUF1540 domain-containing protein [Clostridia bacterium]|nr:DUF1540 domain-containing protein [Clostridia bacterium]